MAIKKVSKLPDGKYKVVETLPTTDTTEIVDKVVLTKAIEVLKQDIQELEDRLAYKENILTEINKLK